MGGSTRDRVNLTRLKPSEIWFTFGRVSDRFSGCGRALESTLRDICEGTLSVDDLPPIAVVTHDAEVSSSESDSSDCDARARRKKRASVGKRRTVRRYYSMNNRRLWVLRRAEELGACESVGVRMESREDCERLLRKGSRNFRLDRCTPGPVKLVRSRESGEGGEAAAREAAGDDDDVK